LGNCGYWDNDDTPIVAVSTAMYKQGGNCNQVCQNIKYPVYNIA
jgi:hypothetical protein